MKILIAVPCMDELDKFFVQSLVKIKHTCDIDIELSESSDVEESRNNLVKVAMRGDYDYIVWFDSDMVFESDILDKLMAAVRGKDFVCAHYYSRRPPFNPVVFSKLRLGLPGEIEAERFESIPKGIFEIEGCGFGCVIMTSQLLRDVCERHPLPFNKIGGFGEDLSFCLKARAIGYKLWCDADISVGHVTKTTITADTYRKFKEGMEGYRHGND